MEKLLFTVPEAARLLSISRSSLYRLLGSQIPVVYLGRSVRIHVDDLRAYVQAQREMAHRRGDA